MTTSGKINSVGIVGAGAMGSGITQVAASAKENVVLFDSDSSALERAKTHLGSVLKNMAEKRKISSDDAKMIYERIHFAASVGEFKNCNLVIEAVVENQEVKQKVFSELEKIVSHDCIIASNTSSLSITSIAYACALPERIAGIHFFNPAYIMPLVEIIPVISTEKKIVENIKERIANWRKTPVVAKDTPGFIVNRVARPFYGEAIRIYEEGIAGFADIDWAMKEIGGFRMGPFELMDLIGNDVNYIVTETIWKQFFYDPKYKPSLTQKRMFEAKYFGRKSGKGYYDYSTGAVKPEPKKDKSIGESIFFRVLAMLINEAADALYYGIAAREDIDMAMTKGLNYPKGLLKWADEIGIEKIFIIIEKLYNEYCEDRYRPSALIRKMISTEKNKFYG